MHWLGMAAVLSVVAQVSPIPKTPLPGSDKARVSLTVDKGTYFLGENALVHYCLENASNSGIQISIGGDYRGTTRPTRFKMTVTDAQGKEAQEADAGYSMGGITVFPVVEAGGQWCQSLPIPRYVLIDEPGTYTVRVVHDLGWEAAAPEGVTTVRFAAPTAAEAEAVVEAMSLLPAGGPPCCIGGLSKPYADFTALRYSVYFPALLKQAEAGDVRAIDGIRRIPTRAAIEALIGLAGHADSAVANRAQQALVERVPVNGRITAGWDPALAGPVRNFGSRLVLSSDLKDVVLGANMIEAAGEPADAPALANALTRTIERMGEKQAEENGATASWAASYLMGAAETLLKRGYRPQSAGTTSGELALWLSASDNPLIRDDDLKEAFGKALEHPSPYLRELALRRMPEGSSTDFVAAIANNIRSADPRVQVAACDLALRDKLSAVSPEVAAAFRTTTEAEGLRSCGSAFRQIAGRFEHVVVLAERIADPAMTPHGLDELIPLLEELNGGGYRPDPTAAEAAALSSRWLRFVRLHREDIEKERPIPLSDPSVSADLVPPGWYLFRNDKPNWPQR